MPRTHSFLAGRVLAAGFVLAGLVIAGAMSGCGEARFRPPDPRIPVAPVGLLPERFPRSGVSFTRPANWILQRGPLPLVATVSSSRALVSVWRYPRSELLPRGHAALERARVALIGAARARDPTFAARLSGLTQLAGFDAIVLLGRETVGSERREVLSVHLFAYRAEVVVDALAPFARFRGLNTTVFAPMLASLRLTPPRARRRRASAAAGVTGPVGIVGPNGRRP